MSKYPDMKAPDHQPPILTGDCQLDIERATAWMADDAVKARAELAKVWEKEKAQRELEAKRAEQERLKQLELARLARELEEQLAEEWVLAEGLQSPVLHAVA